jgi:deoxyribonuclease-1-like protein
MAGFRRKRKSTAQLAVSLFAFALPFPIRRVITSRLGAPIALLVVTALISSGIFTLQWSSGRPRLEVDRERTAEIKHRVSSRVQSVRNVMGESHDGPRLAALLGELAGLNQATRPPFPLETSLPATSPESPPAHQSDSTPPNQRGAAEPAGFQASEVIRIASLDLQAWDTARMGHSGEQGILGDMIRRFEIVAIQQFRYSGNTALHRFVSVVNADGARYSYLPGPWLRGTDNTTQDAFLYDTDRIEVDLGSVYAVTDPRGFLQQTPIVARFRVRGVPPERAFTFTLVNVHTHPDRAAGELDALADVFVGVQRNGSGEDDVMLVGSLHLGSQSPGRLGLVPNITAAIPLDPANPRHNPTGANILLDAAATVEYTGRWGTLNPIAEYRLSGDHPMALFPPLVWAEFSVFEGDASPVARLPAEMSPHSSARLFR